MDTIIKDIAKSINENILNEDDELERFNRAWEAAGLNMKTEEMTVEEAEEFFRKARNLQW